MKEKVLRSLFCFIYADTLARNRIHENQDKKVQELKPWGSRTSLLLATLDAFEDLDGFFIMKNFNDYMEKANYTAEGITTGIDPILKEALYRFRRGVHPEDCGGKEEKDRKPGGLLRAWPLAIYAMKKFDLRKEKGRALQFITKMTGCTHAHPESLFLARRYAELLWDFLDEKGNSLFSPLLREERDELRRLQGEDAKVFLDMLEILERAQSFNHSLELALEKERAKDLAPLVASLSGLVFTDEPDIENKVLKAEEIKRYALQAWLEVL